MILLFLRSWESLEISSLASVPSSNTDLGVASVTQTAPWGHTLQEEASPEPFRAASTGSRAWQDSERGTE